MRNINAAILAQLASEELRPFLLLEMTLEGTTYYYTNCDKSIIWDGNVYEPQEFIIKDTIYSANKIVDQAEVEIQNLDDVMTVFFVGGTPQGSKATLRLVTLVYE